jgi:23S rRNA U2552 (ribose-2'-O)-methylase RlmE/FtsJ
MSKKIVTKKVTKKEKASESKLSESKLSREAPLENEDIPIVSKLPDLSTSIFDYEPNVLFSTNLDYPRSEYGFHHFIHSNKNKTEILQQFEGKKKVYLVFNKFERYIDNYDKSIGQITKEFFSLDESKPDILSRGFYKLWEILLLFDLIDLNKEKFVSAHLVEGPGSFIQATMFYRDTYCKKGVSKNDKYYAVTLHPEDIGGKEHVPELEVNFLSHYQKEKPQRFILHQTYTKQVAGKSKTKDNGNIIDPKTIKLFGGQMDEKADLITGDVGFEWINENVQEQEAFKLVIAQIVAGVKLQKKGGNFVCKFFETFTKTSLKIVSIMRDLYEAVYFVKPLTSRPSNSEKYAVCINFKYDDKSKDFKTISKKLDILLQTIHGNKNEKEKIIDIFTDYEIPKNLILSMINLNREISNPQFKNIGEIVTFIEREIYSGDEYHDKRDEQIKGASFWLDLFLPKTSQELEKNRKKYDNLIKQLLISFDIQVKELEKLMVHVENQN